MIVAGFSLIADMVVVNAQQPAPTTVKYALSETDRLTLQNLQKDALLSQRAAEELQLQIQILQGNLDKQRADLGNKIAVLHKAADDVKEKNKWPKEVTFDDNTVEFSGPAPKPEAPKKEEKK